MRQHPADRLIREVQTRRAATAEEIDQVIERMATAPFDERIVLVPDEYRGIVYQGRVLTSRAPDLFLHLAVRVAKDEQWAIGVTEEQYLEDIRQAIREPSARLVVYFRRGGHIAATFGPNTVLNERRGAKALPWMFVVYAADRGRIISGYQVSSLDRVNIPGDALWLK